jgi:hypothetical protein
MADGVKARLMPRKKGGNAGKRGWVIFGSKKSIQILGIAHFLEFNGEKVFAADN